MLGDGYCGYNVDSNNYTTGANKMKCAYCNIKELTEEEELTGFCLPCEDLFEKIEDAITEEIINS